ncbi:hypothetical protein [Rhizobium miluonense]|nr:hypothetical protein [Rhizobium miluonense]
MMSRFTHAGSSADPLQRPRAAALAKGERPISSDVVLHGIRSIAPRLGLVFLIAGALQLAMRLAGH